MCFSCIVPMRRTSQEINTLKDRLASLQPAPAVVTHLLCRTSTTSLAKATGEALSDISLGSAHREPEGPLIGFPILFLDPRPCAILGRTRLSAVPLDSKCACALAFEVAKKIFFPLATGGEQARQRLSLWHGDSVAELHALS